MRCKTGFSISHRSKPPPIDLLLHYRPLRFNQQPLWNREAHKNPATRPINLIITSTQWESRDALCTLTMLVDSIPVLNARILESQRLLDCTATIMTEVVPGLREVCMMREKLEVDYFENVKVKKELYDGTARLEREPRRFRIRWLKTERKKTRVAKWEAHNLSNRENDLPESDYDSNYSTKSDSEGTLWSSDESS